jgi:hypothetical protein
LVAPGAPRVARSTEGEDAGAAAPVSVLCRSSVGGTASRRASVGRGNVRCCG